jgi:hypothetical protein
MAISPVHFGGALSPLGSCAVTVALGEISIRFRGLTRDIERAAREKYALFLSETPPQHDVMVCQGERRYLAEAADGFLRLEETKFEEGRVLESHDFAALRPADGGAGILRISEPGRLAGAIGCLENYMRWTMADMAIQRGAFVLHSCGVVRDGRAYVFFGHSGAGKSTVAGLSGGDQILSDDLVLLGREADRWQASTTPFWGTFPQEAKAKGSYPVAGIFRLVQAEVVEVHPLSTALAVGMMVTCCPFVSNPALRREKLIPLVEDCCRKVRPAILKFRKDPSFWDAIAREASHVR